MQEWLIKTNQSTINKILTYDNPRDHRRHKTDETQGASDPSTLPFQCQQCEKSFPTKQGLSVHNSSAHKIRNPLRVQVTTPICPGCEKTFTNTINAQRHWSKQICTNNGTAKYTTVQVQLRIDLRQLQPEQAQAQPQTTQGRTIAELIRLMFANSVQTPATQL